MERRLAAIFAADVVGYSRLIRVNEEVSIASWRALQTDIIKPAVHSHGGRIVKLMGDGILAEFASVVAAVRCAIAVQTAVFEREKGQSEDMRIVLRIGVNLGDVIIEDNDVYGDGVNLAVRFEGLAPPGGICISDSVHEQIRDRLDETFADLGEQTVKNIARPVRVWCWRSGGADSAFSGRASTSQTERPVLAVSPFKNLFDDPAQDYFGEGLYEDVLTGLSKVSALRVMSSSDETSGNSADGRMIAREHGATTQYRLEGSIRKAGRRTRITAQLIELRSGNRVWAERFDREMDDVFELQDDVVASIVHALGAADGVIEKTARHSTVEKSGDRATAYDRYLQGRYHFYKHGASGFDLAEQRYLNAIDLDENFAPAYSALAWLYFVQFKLHRSKAFDEIRSKAMDLALKALDLDTEDFRAHWVLGGIYLHDGNHSQSIAEFDKALQINPNDAHLLSWSSEALVYSGQLDEALNRCDRAVAINPKCPDWYHWIKASALFHGGDYNEALKALNRMSVSEHAGKLKAAVHAYLGDEGKARAEAAAFMKLVPTFSINKWAETEHYADPAELARYVEGLRKAGLPE
jgi:adenylate cyclase